MIRLVVPDINYGNLTELKDVINSGILTQGPVTKNFEHMVADYCNVKYALSVNTATSALFLSALSLNLKKDDEVIVPDYTFPATANAVVTAGATPVLADIDLDTYNLSTESILENISEKTKAIMPVHQFGLSANMGDIVKIAKEHNLHILEDSACALGAEYKGKKCGSFGDVSCFSFHPRKIITTGEGGMILTNDVKIKERCESLRNHGIVVSNNTRQVTSPGYNFRLSDINSAIGVNQMKRLDDIINRRRKIAETMNKLLSDIEGIKIPIEPKGYKHTYQSYVIMLDKNINREKLIKLMFSKGVEATSGAMSVHCQPYYSKNYGYKLGAIQNSYYAFLHSLTIPMYPSLTSEDINLIASSLKSSIKDCFI